MGCVIDHGIGGKYIPTKWHDSLKASCWSKWRRSVITWSHGHSNKWWLWNPSTSTPHSIRNSYVKDIHTTCKGVHRGAVGYTNPDCGGGGVIICKRCSVGKIYMGRSWVCNAGWGVGLRLVSIVKANFLLLIKSLSETIFKAIPHHHVSLFPCK